MTERERLDPAAPPSPILKEVATVLTEGGLVVAPTETRYGILARADRREVLEKLYEVKRRDLNKPTSLLVRLPEDIGSLGQMNRSAELLAKAFLPGPLTLVLRSKRDWFPPAVVDGKIGIRCSPLPLVRELLGLVDWPLTATSANRSGKSDFVTVDDIEKEFGDELDFYVDAGPLSGETSTVVDCSREKPAVLREGTISRRQIEAVLS